MSLTREQAADLLRTTVFHNRTGLVGYLYGRSNYSLDQALRMLESGAEFQQITWRGCDALRFQGVSGPLGFYLNLRPNGGDPWAC